MSMFTLYLFMMLDSIGNLMFAFAIIGGMAGAVGAIAAAVYTDPDNNKAFRQGYHEEEDKYKDRLNNNKAYQLAKKRGRVCFKIMIIFPIVFGVFAALLPSTKQMAFIYVASHISQSEMANKIGAKTVAIPDKALDMLNCKLDQYLAEMKAEGVKAVEEAKKEVAK